MTEVGCDPELSQLSHPNPDQAKEGNIGMQQSPRSQGQRREQQTAPFAGGEKQALEGGWRRHGQGGWVRPGVAAHTWNHSVVR